MTKNLGRNIGLRINFYSSIILLIILTIFLLFLYGIIIAVLSTHGTIGGDILLWIYILGSATILLIISIIEIILIRLILRKRIENRKVNIFLAILGFSFILFAIWVIPFIIGGICILTNLKDHKIEEKFENDQQSDIN